MKLSKLSWRLPRSRAAMRIWFSQIVFENGHFIYANQMLLISLQGMRFRSMLNSLKLQAFIQGQPTCSLTNLQLFHKELQIGTYFYQWTIWLFDFDVLDFFLRALSYFVWSSFVICSQRTLKKLVMFRRETWTHRRARVPQSSWLSYCCTIFSTSFWWLEN